MLKKSVMALVCMTFIFAVTGCSTAKVRVMPGEDSNRVVARDRTQEGAEEAANKAAIDYCGDHKKEAIFLKDESKYTGQMDEGTRKAVRNASGVAMVLGGSTGHNSILSSAGMAGYGMTNDRDYESSVSFRCR